MEVQRGRVLQAFYEVVGFKFHVDCEFLKGTRVRGVVLGRNIYFSMPANEIPAWLFRHELEHAYQQNKEGVIKFYLKYFWYILRYGYRKNPFEVEAYAVQNQPLDELEEELLWTLRES